ncbi:S-methyl-5-thioribose-1-phosphate isomerase [Candidatus Litorirhabdus singularis]|nr:S-methyl-5-thioribose-1-phosphate isomerase [Candidatus Litorirhabdus singularis]
MQRSLQYSPEGPGLQIIDQTLLPHQLRVVSLRTLDDFCTAISSMQVRGAPLIGVTAAYGLALSLAADASDAALGDAIERLLETRPTAINLAWALERVRAEVVDVAPARRAGVALAAAQQLAADDIAVCQRIGEHGLTALRGLPALAAGRTLQIMTHCNAGWLAAIEWGTALAPIYAAHADGIPVHVWVSETRPRNQGLHLTSWELEQAGIAHTVIADNAAGHLLQSGRVDACIVGSDRTVANGDVCNKIGTYMKALAASAHAIPFYVALPVSTIDWACATGADIPIEERHGDEVREVSGIDASGREADVRLTTASAVAYNPAFDVTPAALVTALITECGLVLPTQLAQSKQALLGAG